MPKIIATKKDWVLLGYQQFSQIGISGLVVEKMAKKLQVNKSSFYWHFKTKHEFIGAIVNYWIETETLHITKTTDKEKNITKKWNAFLKITFLNYPYLDFIFHLKRYAQKHPETQKIIDDIDKQRLDYTTNLLQEMGYSASESKIKASIFYKYLIGYHEMIRYKKQSKNYLNEVKKEVQHFIECTI